MRDQARAGRKTLADNTELLKPGNCRRGSSICLLAPWTGARSNSTGATSSAPGVAVVTLLCPGFPG